MSSMDVDLVLTGPAGDVVAVVEVKARRGTDVEWARQLSTHLFQDTPRDRVFTVLVTPDRMYLWRPGHPPATDPETIDLSQALEPYFGRARVDREGVGPRAFELLVANWLMDAALGPGSAGLPSDLTAAIRNAKVRTEAELRS